MCCSNLFGEGEPLLEWDSASYINIFMCQAMNALPFTETVLLL